VIGDDDVLRYENRLCVPNIDDLGRELMTETYQTIYTVHPSSPRCIKILRCVIGGIG
jgi:hypothetical protein